jgi:hypothetical protein
MIQITFTPSTSQQAELIGKMMAQYLAIDEEPVRTTPGLIAAAQEEAAAPAPKRTKKPVPATTTASENLETPTATAGSETVAAAAEDPKPAAEPQGAPELSLEDVRAKLTAISKAGKAAEVKGLLTNLGVTNLTSVPKEAYAKLVADAEAL